MSKVKRLSYDTAFKLKVIEYAEQRNNSVAAREFGVSTKQVREWRKAKNVLKTLPRKKKAMSGKTAQFPKLEEKLFDWVQENRCKGLTITRTSIRMRALYLARNEFKESCSAHFCASAGWCSRFMERHRLTLRQRTKIAQKLPEQLEEKLIQWQKYIIRLRKKHGFDLSQIANMDETPVTFDLPSNTTVNSKGASSVLIRTTGHEKTRFTVVLSCLANGDKLTFMVIFKQKTLPKSPFSRKV